MVSSFSAGDDGQLDRNSCRECLHILLVGRAYHLHQAHKVAKLASAQRTASIVFPGRVPCWMDQLQLVTGMFVLITGRVYGIYTT